MNEPDARIDCGIPPDRSRGWWELVILSAAIPLLFAGLGTRALWHSEGRWAEITREMFLTGDFFHPTIGGEPYFDKPLLTYWLVAGVAVLTNRLDEWTARFPSALSGLVVLATTMWIGRRLWSARVGQIAGIVLLTSYGFLLWSRTAAADMENLAAIMLAVAWYWKHADRPGFAAFVGFYLIAFLGALCKGLPAVIVPVIAVLPDVVIRRRWRQVLTPGHALAFCIGLAVYLAPFLYAARTNTEGYNESGLALVFRENIVRFVRPFDHTGPVYLYLYYLPFLMLPWAPLLVAAVVGFIRIRGERDQQTAWLSWAVIVIFAFFTASGSRRGYYILVLLPFCSLMIGVLVAHLRAAALTPILRHGLRAQGILFALVVALEVVGGLAGKPIGERFGVTLPQPTLVSLTVVAAGALVLGYFAYRHLPERVFGPPRSLAAMTGAAVAVMGGFFCWQRNTLEVFRTERPFMQSIAARTKDLSSSDIGVYRNNSAILLFYLNSDRPIKVLRNEDELREFLAVDRERVVLTQARFAADARNAARGKLSEASELTQERAPWESAPSRDDWVAWHVPGDRGVVRGVVSRTE